MKKIPLIQLVGAGVFCVYFWMCIVDQDGSHFIDTVNLIFHEAGHALFFFLPELLVALAGSLFQILVPLTFVIYFYKRRELLSANILIFWLAQNIVSVSVYVRDALSMQLPLLGGDGSIHDWNFILSTLNLLNYHTLIANGLVAIGCFCMVAATLWLLEAFYILVKTRIKK